LHLTDCEDSLRCEQIEAGLIAKLQPAGGWIGISSSRFQISEGKPPAAGNLLREKTEELKMENAKLKRAVSRAKNAADGRLVQVVDFPRCSRKGAMEEVDFPRLPARTSPRGGSNGATCWSSKI